MARNVQIGMLAIDLERLPMWTIYNRPSDWPKSYVARLFYSLPAPVPLGWELVYADLDRLREEVRERGGAYIIPRSPDDDPVIVETWML